MSSVSSFRKKSSSKPSHPRGTRPSFHNAQLLASTGVPSLDPLLGGGITVGSILLLEEDLFENYSRILLKYFLAEGVMCGHSIVLAAPNESSINIINDLPAAVVESHSTTATSNISMPSLVEDDEYVVAMDSSSAGNGGDMKIAWRYKDKPIVQSSFSNKFGHNFDLTKRMEKERMDKVAKHLFTPDSGTRSASLAYDSLFTFIKESLKEKQPDSLEADSQQTKQNTIHRIAIHSLGSPLWLQDTNGEAIDLTSFLHRLRGVVKTTNAVALVTVPTHLFQDSTVVDRVERLCDSVIRTESFEGSDKQLNPLYKDYHGLFHLVKLPKINTLTAHYPETLELTFKLKRKKFVIEKLHLPPELSSTANRTQEDPVKAVKRGGRPKPTPASGAVVLARVQDEF